MLIFISRAGGNSVE